MSKVKVGMIGAGFVSDIHAHSFKHFVPNAEVVAVASPSSGEKFAKERGIPHAFKDYREMLKLKEIDVVTVALPNDLHAQVTIDAANAGKHESLQLLYRGFPRLDVLKNPAGVIASDRREARQSPPGRVPRFKFILPIMA